MKSLLTQYDLMIQSLPIIGVILVTGGIFGLLVWYTGSVDKALAFLSRAKIKTYK